MKTIILSVALAMGVATTTPVFAAAEIKEVCKDRKDKAGKVVVDKKTNKPTQDCKKIKVHKKLEGTKVPEKK
jgi:hypothetical protein